MTDTLKYPFTFEEITEEEKKLLHQCHDIEIVRVSGTKFTILKTAEKYGSELYNFKPKPDDIWLIGFPRSGTTLTQEILYLLGTDLDYKKAASTVMDMRFPYLESVLINVSGNVDLYEKLIEENKQPESPEELESIPPHIRLAGINGRRFIKSHLNFMFLHPDLLNIGCKVVYIVRNIKDCFVSNYYFPWKDDVEKRGERRLSEMMQIYKNNLCAWGNYFEGLKEAWQRRNNKNLLFLIYEEVVADKRGAITKIAEFLGKKLTEDQLNKLVDHVSVENFKKNDSLNNAHLVNTGVFVKNDNFSFIRKGGSGGWRQKFTKEMNDTCNEWIRENLAEIPDFEMPECWKKAMDL